MALVQVKHTEREVLFVGIGMGGLGQITWEGIEALLCSDAWLGAARMIESGKTISQYFLSKGWQKEAAVPLEKKQICTTYRPEEMLDWLILHPQVKHPAVLYSGDVGFYSGARGLAQLLNNHPFPCSCRMIPGISSLSYFAARIGRNWEDVHVISFHGREEEMDWHLSDGRECFLLLDGTERLHWVCCCLLEHGQREAKLWVGEWFSYPRERIISASPEEILTMKFDHLLAAWIAPKK